MKFFDELETNGINLAKIILIMERGVFTYCDQLKQYIIQRRDPRGDHSSTGRWIWKCYQAVSFRLNPAGRHRNIDFYYNGAEKLDVSVSINVLNPLCIYSFVF